MNGQVEQTGSIRVVHARGVIHGQSVTSLKAAVLEQVDHSSAAVALDMRQVTFVNSRGLEGLLEIRDLCGARAVPFRLVGLTDAVRTILEMTRLTGAFTACDTLPEAVKSLV